ncbi:MAG TPA: response regulator [Bacteroidia bacterium]|nr:response regulator [Bacteroidia bacterium]
MEERKVKVMVVEDSNLIVQRLYSILSEIHFIKSIAHAKNGEEAFTLMKLINPELVLLDIKMPGINGIEVLKRIKTTHKDSRVVMLTNYPTMQYKELCLGLGADHFLDKSTELDRIGDIITSLQGKIPVS